MQVVWSRILRHFPNLQVLRLLNIMKPPVGLGAAIDFTLKELELGFLPAMPKNLVVDCSYFDTERLIIHNTASIAVKGFSSTYVGELVLMLKSNAESLDGLLHLNMRIGCHSRLYSFEPLVVGKLNVKIYVEPSVSTVVVVINKNEMIVDPIKIFADIVGLNNTGPLKNCVIVTM